MSVGRHTLNDRQSSSGFILFVVVVRSVVVLVAIDNVVSSSRLSDCRYSLLVSHQLTVDCWFNKSRHTNSDFNQLICDRGTQATDTSHNSITMTYRKYKIIQAIEIN